MNKKVRRVDMSPHVRTVVFRLCCENYRFSTKLLYAVAYVGGCCHPPLRTPLARAAGPEAVGPSGVS